MINMNIVTNFYHKHRYQVQKTISNLNHCSDETVLQNYIYKKFRNCVLVHKEAIKYVFIN